MTLETTTPALVEPALLTIPEAALRLSVSRDTIHRLARAGELELVHVMAGSWITVRSIDAYLERIASRAVDGG